MDENVKTLLGTGIRPIDLQFLTVNQLEQVYEHFGIEYEVSAKSKKETFLNQLHVALRESGCYAEEDPDAFKRKTLELEIKKAELESLNLQSKKEVLALELQVKQEGKNTPAPSTAINTSVLPLFDEKDPESFFAQFEKIAFHWNRELWPILVQTNFQGKAREAFANLTEAASKDYDQVKAAVLLAYELSAEAYRQRFRTSRMDGKMSYVDFAALKSKEFGKWVHAAKLDSYDQLKEAVLIEEFLEKIPLDMRQYLMDKEQVGIQPLAQAADAFALTKKLGSKGTPKEKFSKKSPPGDKAPAHCVKCGKWGPNHEQCPESMKSIRCKICEKTGHYTLVCSKKKGDKEKQERKGGKAVGFVKQKAGEDALFAPHLYRGQIASSRKGKGRAITMLRDTGAAQSLVLKSVLDGRRRWKRTGDKVIIRSIGNHRDSVPLVRVYLTSELVSGWCDLGVVDSLPIKSAQLLLGNDAVYGAPSDSPIMCGQVELRSVEEFSPEIFPACAVTRSQSRNESVSRVPEVRSNTEVPSPVVLDKAVLPEEQRDDPTLNGCFSMLEGSAKCPANVEFFLQNGVLVRRWTSLTSTNAHLKGDSVRQVVLPKKYRCVVLETAHSLPMAGHLGIRSTYEKVLRHFFWPGMRGDVARFCKSCLVCQQVGKPNQVIPKAALHPIPAFGDPFTDIVIDFVGPLPKSSSGKQYLLTVMCKATRYPEAFPMSSTRTVNVISALSKFFCQVGLPTSIQSDNDSSFCSDSFKSFVNKYGIEHILSTPYRPQSQGVLERYHQTLKTMLKKFCLANTSSWDVHIPFLLFCTRDTVQESLGFSPFQLVFGHRVRGPLSVLKNQCLSESQVPNLLERVEDSYEKLRQCREFARENLQSAQGKMKSWYDRKSATRSFSPGDQCLVFLPISRGALSAKFFGPYKVLEKVSELTYRIATPDRGRRQRVCHINQLKKFIGPYEEEEVAVAVAQVEETEKDLSEFVSPRLANSAILADLRSYLCGTSPEEYEELSRLILSFPEVFSDKLGRTNLLTHDVELSDETPVHQRPYRTSPTKARIMEKEVEFLVSEGLASPAEGEWASPCLLVPKPDGTFRFCVDYRLANKQIKSDAFPMPRLLDCVDQIGEAKLISKLDLLKGYWQVPLSPKAKKVYSFVTGAGLYNFDVLPFGCKNAPASFQRLMNKVVHGIPGVACYLDDIIVYSDTLPDHLSQLTRLLEALREANLVVNLAKSEFLKSSVEYLGHVVGQGNVKPKTANVQSILDMKAPSDLKSLRRFLGASGFYRRFCRNFSSVCLPLTNLLQKGRKFQWSSECQQAFEDIKAMLSFEPVLKSPNFTKPFVLYTDASGVGVGGVLMQKDSRDIERPVAYFSRKLNKHQLHYSPIEKECLAIVLCIAHFCIYLNNGHTTKVFTDHNPLAFLSKMKEKNQKLLRWSLFLQEYDIDIVHIRGKDNVIADMLSRT